MFTDTEATPARVEMLLDVVRSMSARKLDAAVIKQLLQPAGLPSLTSSSTQAARTIFAARELELIEEQSDGTIRATRSRDTRSARRAVVEAMDDKILASDDVEPWFALFYAYVLGRDGSAPSDAGAIDQWVANFERDLFPVEKPTNRFNGSKYRGLRRWFRYAGLGWHDAEDCFHPNPYERVARRLPDIFGKDRELPIDLFLQRLSERCPELDGGHIYLKANTSRDRPARMLTLGVSHALIELHLDGALELDCPLDSDGWSIAKASPPRDSTHLKSDKISSVRRAASKVEAACG